MAEKQWYVVRASLFAPWEIAELAKFDNGSRKNCWTRIIETATGTRSEAQETADRWNV